MAFYYVKNGGTAVGDDGRYASQQTGTFATLGASGYYNDILDAIGATTPPVAGDFINISDLDVDDNGRSILGIASTPFFLVSVDDANIENGRTSGNRAIIGQTSTSADNTLTNLFASGIQFRTGDDNVFAGNNQLYDCELKAIGSTDRPISVISDGASLTMVKGLIVMDFISTVNVISRAFLVDLTNVDITTITGGVTNFFSGGFTDGGGVVHAKGCDLTAIIGTLFAGVGAASVADDLIDIRLDLCKIASGVAFTSEDFRSYNQRALFTRCSDSSAAAEYQYHLHAFGGDVDDDSAIFRNEDEPFTESNQKISYKIVTNSDASLGSPLWFDFPVLRYSRLSAGATDTLRFFITSNTTLTDKDIYIEISYPDGTNKQTPNFLSSAPTTVGGTLDLMAAGTTLTTDGSSSWTGALSNLYQIDVDTSGDVGADCQPIVKVYVTLPSVTIQIASEYGLS